MPDVLYKYLPPARVDVLSKGRIRFSPVEDLNDPFESRPMTRVNPASAERSARASGYRGAELARAVKSFTEYATRRGPEALRQLVNEELGILSLSADPLQPVMWGQYAQGYRGYVIGLDARHRWLAPEPSGHDVTSRPRRVRYQLERPQLELAGSNEMVDHEAFWVGLILTKHEAWAFEREYRVGKDSRGAIPPDEADGVSHLFALPGEVVLEVLLGPRMAQDTEAELKAVLGSGRYPKAQLKRLVIDTESYLLRSEPVLHT